MYMKRMFVLLFLLGTVLGAVSQEHIQWRGDNRDGKYDETGLLKVWPEDGPQLLWVYEGLGDGHGSAAVAADRIYTSGMLDGTGYVFALDHSGKLVWKTPIGKSWTDNWDGVRTTPLIYKSRIYILSAFGKLVCMDRNTGSLIWSKNLFEQYNGRNIKWGITENLLIDENKLFVTLGGEKANVIALNPENGELIWSSEGKGEISAYNSPAVFTHEGRRILVTQTQNSILGLDAKTGALLWDVSHTNQWSVHPNTPLYSDGFVYVVSGYGKGGVKLKLSADGNNVDVVWRNSTLDNQMGGVILHDGRLYGAGHNNRELICLDWKTGEELYSTRDFQRGNTIFAEGMLYCYDEKGKVGLIRPEENEFNIVSEFEVTYGERQHWAHLVIHDKKLYVRHGNALMVYSIAR